MLHQPGVPLKPAGPGRRYARPPVWHDEGVPVPDPAPGPDPASGRTFEVLGHEEALPDEVLAKLEARRALLRRYADPDAPAPARPAAPRPGAVVPDATPDLSGFDISALVEAHLEARTEARTREQARQAERTAEVAASIRALRASAPAESLEARHARLRAAVEAEVPDLAAAAAALERQATTDRLVGLAASLRRHLPAPDLGLLAKEGARQVVTNNLDPVSAAALAVSDAGLRMRAMGRWGELQDAERVAHVAAFAANMADVVGVVTPPPANFAAQAMGLGLALVAMAADPVAGRRRRPGEALPGAPGPDAPEADVPRAEAPKPPGPKSPTGALHANRLAERRENLHHNVGARMDGWVARVQKLVDDRKAQAPNATPSSAPPRKDPP